MLKLDFIGNIGKPAECRASQTGEKFYTFSVGVAKNKTTTQWVDVSISGSYGEKIHTFLQKGAKIYVSGTPSTRAYVNKSNEPVAVLSVYANTIELLGKKEVADTYSSGLVSEDEIF